MDSPRITSSKNAHLKLNKKPRKSPTRMSVKVVFIPLEKLRGKTQAKLLKIHSLTVAMLPPVAAKRGFIDQFITVSTKNGTFPALLVLDKKLKEDISIVAESIVSYTNLISEGDDITLFSHCPKLFAEDVSFCHVSHKELSGSVLFTQFLKEQLVFSNLVICASMNIVVQYLSQKVTLKVQNVKFFAVHETQCPQTPFQCIWQTHIHTECATGALMKPMNQEIEFKDVGGYQTELQNLHNQIDMLFSPTPNVKPVKGILISGASGCGKSLIGEALKAKFGNKCINILLEDVKSKFRGETEQNLKKIFNKAAIRAPCLLFIDDIDILCSSRDKSGHTGIVTALLHLMDGLTSSMDGIMVIATASNPQTLDAALRRPGRLSYDLLLPPPDEYARIDILQKMLAGVPHDLEVSDIMTIAANTHGYVGGDLRSVVMESVMQTEGKILSKQDLDASLTIIKPAALRDSTVSELEIKLSDICGYERIKSKLQEAISLTLSHGSVFQRCGISPPSRFLLFGPPGCGKSSIILALANEFHLSVISVKRSTVLGKYFGESEQNLAKIFSQASNSSPCILHFENFEGLAGKKKLGEDGGTDLESRIINHLKVQLDGIVRNDSVFIFAETNRPDLLNKDVIRPGRFNEYYLVDLPEPEDRQLILSKYMSSCRLLEYASLDDLVNLTRSFTVAEILHFIEEVKIQSKQDHILKLSESLSTVANDNSVEEILESVIPRTSQKMLQKYQNFAQTHCAVESKEMSN